MLTFILYFCIKLGLLQLYPAYITYKAVKVNNHNEYTSLLIFWVVSVTYLSIEYFTDIFLFWIPFYTEFKLILLLWLILPQTQGTTLVYNRYLFPYLEQNEEYIDTTLISIQHKLKDILVLYGKQCIDGMKKIVLDMFFKGQQTNDTPTPPAPLPPPPPSENIINPYRLFSTFITKNQKDQIKDESTRSMLSSDKTTQLQPVNSEESIQSYVSVNASNDINDSITWGNYLSSWVWKDTKKMK